MSRGPSSAGASRIGSKKARSSSGAIRGTSPPPTPLPEAGRGGSPGYSARPLRQWLPQSISPSPLRGGRWGERLPSPLPRGDLAVFVHRLPVAGAGGPEVLQRLPVVHDGQGEEDGDNDARGEDGPLDQ